jgi:hypothetical protein
MMLVSTKGEVSYVGPVGGYLPQMLLKRELARARVAGAGAPKPPAVQATPEPTPADASEAVETAVAPELEVPQVPAEPSDSAAERQQAQQMLSVAQVRRRISPNAALGMCDQVLERWPDTPEAEEARALIRSILEEGRNQDLLEQRKQQGKYTGQE